MKNKLARNKSLLATFLIAAIGTIPNASAVKVNGHELDEEFTYQNPKNATHIAFKFDNGGITVGGIGLKEDIIDQAKARFSILKPQLGEVSSTEPISISCPEIKGQFLQVKQAVILRGKEELLKVESCILESDHIQFEEASIEIKDTFVISRNPITFHLTAPNSIVKEIKIIPSSANPVLLQGNIDFFTPATDKFFIAVGAHAVWMKF